MKNLVARFAGTNGWISPDAGTGMPSDAIDVFRSQLNLDIAVERILIDGAHEKNA